MIYNTEFYDAEDNDYLFSDKENNIRNATSAISSEADSDNEEVNVLNDIENENDPPLFARVLITESGSLLSILALITRFKVTGVMLVAILTLIAMHCPKPIHCIESLYFFKKYFEDYQASLTTHFYCEACFENLESTYQN